MLVYAVLYAAAFLLSRIPADIPAGICLVSAAVFLFLEDMRRTVEPFHLRALFSLSFVGGEGISCLKLSRLGTRWEPETWLCFFLAYAAFWIAFEKFPGKSGKTEKKNGCESSGKRSLTDMDRLFRSIVGIAAISFASFCAEAYILKFIPLFLRGVPHAYSYFHVHGLHYFTVSCVLVPAFSAVWMLSEGEKEPGKKRAVVLSAAVSFCIPILCVSRFQFLFTVAAVAITVMMMRHKKAGKKESVIALLVLMAVYAALTAARGHSVSYLNGIFEMKRELPVFLSQPYIYIANNYDNFNCLVKELPAHTFGMRLLFPLWALSGMKFFFPTLVNFPIYVTKAELTTVTLIYDAWYDFGVAGVVVFSGAVGFAASRLEKRMNGEHSPIVFVLYSEMAVYMALAFFTTWFSNPATWFYFAETLAVYLYCGKRKSRQKAA